MTAKLQPYQKSYFIQMAETSFNDVCTIRSFVSRTKNSYADLENTYTDIEDVPCGFSFSSNEFKAELGLATISEIDALLRLSLEQDIKQTDLVICRDRTFSVDGIYPGTTVQVVTLKYYSSEE